jgi:UDP-glucose 4-epimerase
MDSAFPLRGGKPSAKETSEIMNKILITGVSGFIGRNAARFLAAQGREVYGIDSNPEESAPLHDLHRYFRLRLPSRELDAVIEELKPQACIHCAGRASVALSVSDPKTDFEAGPVLTWDFLDVLRRKAPGCRTVFLSSAAVYGSPQELPVAENAKAAPISPYGYHKLQGELVCAEFAVLHGMPIASARVFSAYGPGLRRQVVWDLFHQALNKRVISAQGTGAESRDFMHISDICGGLDAVLKKGLLHGETYNFGSGEETAISQLAEMIKGSVGEDVVIEFDGRIPEGTPLNWRADISGLRRLGYVPKIGMQEGVSAFGKWCKAELGML